MSTPASSLFDPGIAAPAAVDSFRKLDPRRMARNPVMFVTEIGAAFATILFFKDLGDATAKANVFAGSIAAWLWFTVLFANFAEAMAEGRGKAQAATLRKTRAETTARRRLADGAIEEVPSSQLAVGDQRRRHGRRDHPRRRRHRRGHRHRRRVGDHRRVGPGHPRVGRRPLRRHRRHAGAVGRDRRPRHDPRRRDLPRPHDRARRGREPPEDAERDRARHPARGADDHLPARDRDAAALRRLLGRGAVGDRPHRAARLPDPDDDRRPALRDRHRRHGPPRAAQRARHERPRRRGRRRLLDAAARQDRHDHARQPPGDRLHPGAGRHRARSSPTPPSSRASPTRRPRAARSSCSRRSATTSAAAELPGRRARPLHGPDAHERRRRRRPQHPQGRRRRGPPLGRGARRHASRRARRRRRRDRVAPAARRSSSPRTAARSASSTSRTSSRRASASASRSCARWASARS